MTRFALGVTLLFKELNSFPLANSFVPRRFAKPIAPKPIAD
jgi:hypothetical protein